MVSRLPKAHSACSTAYTAIPHLSTQTPMCLLDLSLSPLCHSLWSALPPAPWITIITPCPILSPPCPHRDLSTRRILLLLLGNPPGLATACRTCAGPACPAFAPCPTSQPALRYCRWPAPRELASVPWPRCFLHRLPLPHVFTRPSPRTRQNTLVLLQNTFSRLSYLDGCPISHIFRMPSEYADLTSYHIGFKLSIDVGAVTTPSCEHPSVRNHFASVQSSSCPVPRT